MLMHDRLTPKLFCPFSSALNPYTAETHEQTLAWASRFQLIQSPAVDRRFRAAQFSRVVGRAYPNAATDDLRLICDWNTALFVWDDHCDETRLGWQPEQLAARCELLLAVLQDRPDPQPDDRLLRAFADVGSRLRERMPPMWMRRFLLHVQEYLEGTLWEAHNRARRITPDLTSYVQMRHRAGALHPYFEFAYLTEQIGLPIEIRSHPLVERLSLAAANLVVWANDIVSLAKELEHGDVHNLVTVLQHEQHVSMSEAIEQAAAMHDAEMRLFIELEQRLPSFEPELDAALQRYIGVLRSWIRANLDWSSETGRYQQRPSGSS